MLVYVSNLSARHHKIESVQQRSTPVAVKKFESETPTGRHFAVRPVSRLSAQHIQEETYLPLLIAVLFLEDGRLGSARHQLLAKIHCDQTSLLRRPAIF